MRAHDGTAVRQEDQRIVADLSMAAVRAADRRGRLGAMTTHTPTIHAELTRQAARLGHRPAVVFRDAGSGERTELSWATLHNWVSKTANLLSDSFDVGLGSEVHLSGPLHWMVPVVALGTWATGAAVRLDPGGEVVIGHESDGVDVDLLIGAGMGGRPTVADAGDALTVTDVLGQPDDFVDDPGDEGAWAVGGRSQATLLAEGLSADVGRILLVGDRTTEDAVFLLAHALPAGVSVVLARGYDEAGLRGVASEEGVG